MTDDCLLLFLYKCLDFKGISQVNFLQPGGQSNYEKITDNSIADTGNLSGHVAVTLKENSTETISYHSRCNSCCIDIETILFLHSVHIW